MKLHEIVDNEPMIYPLLKQLMAKGTSVHMLTWGTQENIVTDVKLRQVDDLTGDGMQPSLEIFMKHVEQGSPGRWFETTTSFRVPTMTDKLELKKVKGQWRVIYPDFEALDDHETE
jgi:hypothetical protein